MVVATSTIIPVLRLLRPGGGVTTASAAPTRKKAANFAAGDLVDHKVFGRGKVLKVTPVAGDCIVEIQFDRVGIKNNGQLRPADQADQRRINH